MWVPKKLPLVTCRTLLEPLIAVEDVPDINSGLHPLLLFIRSVVTTRNIFYSFETLFLDTIRCAVLKTHPFRRAGVLQLRFLLLDPCTQPSSPPIGQTFSDRPGSLC